MEKLLIISAESALTEILSAELPECAVALAGTSEEISRLIEAASMVIVDKDSAVGITPPETVPFMIIHRPVRLSELLYTIRERLQAKTRAAKDDVRIIGSCRFFVRERVLMTQGDVQRVTLTEKEGDLLSKLLEDSYKTINKEAILRDVWRYAEGTDTHTLETHIYRLRGKLRQVNSSFDIISEDGSGYKISLNQEIPSQSNGV